MHAGRQPAARHRRRRAPWIDHRGGEGAALLAAVGHPPHRPARGRDRRATAATGRPRDPAHPGRAAAGRPRRRDHRADRCRRRRALRPRGADRRPRAPGQLRLSHRIAGSGGGGGAGGQASGPAGRPDRHASARGDRVAAHRQGRGRDHLPLRRDRPRAGRRSPASPARRSGVPAVAASRARAGLPARRDLDRRLRSMPQPPADPCAPTPGSIRRSATAPTTWS